MSSPKQWRNNGGQIEELRDDNWYYIAEVGEANSQRPIDTERANLMASAPELLKELEENVEAIRELFCDEHREIEWDEMEQLLSNILNDNLIAIAKARGEA